MSFNLDYQLEHLPWRYRRGAGGELLRRFLTFFGEQLDRFDQEFETLHTRVRPETAGEDFVEHWCRAFFGWGWFPDWFTLEQKRDFYRDLARHLARRGTPAGIEGFLRAFGVYARVFTTGAVHWDEFYWGESEWMITRPLALVVQVFPMRDVALTEQEFWGEFHWDEAYFAPHGGVIEQADVEALLRFQAPLGQDIYIEYLTV